jgi:CelD/BcsL family acetyltransferase involved in cellulose biosynthesis
MKISVVPARLLAGDHIQRWCDLQAADSSLSSPFLSPEFTMAVAAVRDDVEVGILERGVAAVGFFPFQRGRFSRGRPVGLWLNDLQAVVAEPGTEWGCLDLVRGCRLVELEFSRLLGSQVQFEPFHYQRRRYAFIDVSRGYDTYVEGQRQAANRAIQNADALARKFERDIGPLRFETHSRDAAALSTLMKWKFERYRAHGYVDIFAIPWVRGLMHQVHATQTERFSGVLSVLYAGDEMAAAHLGMRCLRDWHYWYHAYNPKFARYSPGLTLLLRVARHAGDFAVERIALGGCDEYGYKQDLMNSSITVLEGFVSRIPGVAPVRRWRHAGEHAIRESSVLRPPARGLLRAYRRLKHGLLYDHVDDGRHRDRSAAKN